MPRKHKQPGSGKRRVLLLCHQPLLGEGLEAILRELQDVELIGPLDLEAQWLDRLSSTTPDVVLIAGEEGEVQHMTSPTQILDHYLDVPVIRVGLQQDAVRLYTSRTLPARSADLIEAIRRLPVPMRPGMRRKAGALETEDTKRQKR